MKLITGGGAAKCEIAADIHQLEEWLTDKEPRCILLDKTYDYTGTQGRIKMPACKPNFDKCPDGGQLALDIQGWCKGYPRVPDVEVDKAALATSAIAVQSDKTIRGLTDKAVIKGRGLLLFHVTNIIIQNIWFTELNPEVVFGGDAIALKNTDLIWIDHNIFNNIGRQMLVTGHEPIGRITISFNKFDGTTKWSASCNGHHYWALLFYGQTGSITFAMNYILNTSGRGPEIAGSGSGGSQVTVHAVGNVYDHILGNAFDIGEGATVIAFQNSFLDVLRPLVNDPKHPGVFLMSQNVLTRSGELKGEETTDIKLIGWDHLDTGNVKNVNPMHFAGIGKI